MISIKMFFACFFKWICCNICEYVWEVYDVSQKCSINFRIKKCNHWGEILHNCTREPCLCIALLIGKINIFFYFEIKLLSWLIQTGMARKQASFTLRRMARFAPSPLPTKKPNRVKAVLGYLLEYSLSPSLRPWVQDLKSIQIYIISYTETGQDMVAYQVSQ